MSVISDGYEELIDIVEEILPDHTRLSNPYKPAENNELLLKQGWGVALNGATSPRGLISCKLSMSREVTIVISRKYFAKESDGPGKAVTELALMEDQFLLIKEIAKNTSLNETVAMAKFVSDSGIQYVSFEKDQFMMIETVFLIEYFEDLT